MSAETNPTAVPAAKVKVKLRSTAPEKTTDPLIMRATLASAHGTLHERMAIAREFLDLLGVRLVSYDIAHRIHRGAQFRILCEIPAFNPSALHARDRRNINGWRPFYDDDASF